MFVNRKNLFFLFLFFGLTWSVGAQSSIDTVFLKKSLEYSISKPYIQYSKNTIEWYQKEAIYPFFEKLKNSSNKKVKILHIGDSHIQPEKGTGVTRNKLQEVFGYGGRGFVFPYQLAGTASAYDYKAVGSGKWQSSKNVEFKPKLNLGLSGITVFTQDSTAGFKIIFDKSHASIHPNFRKIKIYCLKNKESFDLKVSTKSRGNQIHLNCSREDGLPYVEFEIPIATDTLIVNVDKTNTNQIYFECYGLDIESIEDKGVEYISVGIAGAAYQSIFHQNKMKEQLQSIQPDLVIFDLGVNNFYKGDFDYEYVMGCLNQMIEFVRANCPNACFLLPNSQDIYFKSKNIVNCKEYSILSRLVAKEQKVALYDYFEISGGIHSMLNWSKDGLSNKDQCHLSTTGYKFKGELFFNGIMNGYLKYLESSPASYVNYSIDSDTMNRRKWVVNKSIGKNCGVIAEGDKIDNYKNTTNPVLPSITTNNTTNTSEFIVVKAGESLSILSKRHSISIQDLKSINGLKSDNITVGQKLKIKR